MINSRLVDIFVDRDDLEELALLGADRLRVGAQVRVDRRPAHAEPLRGFVDADLEPACYCTDPQPTAQNLAETLRQECRITVSGPTTLSALLNSLQMGFRTLAIQKRSNEVWEVLGAVKTEFEKFGDTMRKMQTHLSQTTSDLDALIGTRSRAIERRLRSVQKLDDEDARKLLEDI